jgi:hypothetical protein
MINAILLLKSREMARLGVLVGALLRCDEAVSRSGPGLAGQWGAFRRAVSCRATEDPPSLKHINLNYCFNYITVIYFIYVPVGDRTRSLRWPQTDPRDPSVQNYECAWLCAGMAALAMSSTQPGISSVRRRGKPLFVLELAPEGQFINGRCMGRR